MLAAQVLGDMNFVCEEADDGREALRRIEDNPPDLVILDLEMPGLDGFDTCRAIRAAESTSELPILVATGLTDGDTIDLAYDAGATHFLKKPIDFSILRHHVKFVLRAHDTFSDLSHTLANLEASDQRLEAAQRLARLGHWEWSPEVNEMLWSNETFRILGRDLLADPQTLDAFLESVHTDDRAKVEKRIRNSTVEGGAWNLDHRIVTSDGEIRVVQQHAIVSTGLTGACVSGTIQDITERRRAEEQIDFLAHYDTLTALPNRKRFCEQLDRALVLADQHDESVGIIQIDLDRFERINDTLGRDVGDDLLRAVARRLQTSVRSTDLVAQTDDDATAVSSLGGDEFSVIMSPVRAPEDLRHVARRIVDAFRLPFTVAGHEIQMSASIGVAIAPMDGGDTLELLRSASTATHHAKAHGGGTYRFFSASMNDQAVRRMKIEMELTAAAERGELRLVYQPQWCARTGEVTGMEALLRWTSEKLGEISPGEFIPVAESTNLIDRVGEWVFSEVCRQIQTWQRDGLELVPVAVNFSSRQLRTTRLAKLLTRIMEIFEVDPRLIEIEMTESAVVGNLEEVLAVLDSLKATGVRIALDDFGTGYSSISHLARFPIDVLKIDQSFVLQIDEDEQVSTLVSALIAMAKRLSLSVVAEGVETDSQASFLRSEGCDVLQGFYLSRPLEVDAASHLLRSAFSND
jgi:diguanylate cyclase (GGDEF)-like protein